MRDVRVLFRSSSGDVAFLSSDGDSVTQQRHPNTDSETNKWNFSGSHAESLALRQAFFRGEASSLVLPASLSLAAALVSSKR